MTRLTTAMILRSPIAINGAILLSACGGGSGAASSGSIATPPPTPAPTPAPAPTPSPTPTPTSTAEYLASGALVGAKAQYAYDRGITGKGVTIAVIDTGIDVDHREFAGRISPDSRSFPTQIARCTTCSPETVVFGLDDVQGHGTMTASVAAAAADAKGLQGIAPDSTILALKIAAPDLTGVTATSVIRESSAANSANIAPAIRYAVEKGAFAITMSINGFAGGQVATEQRAAMDQVRTNDRLLVQSITNDVGVDSFKGQIADNLAGPELANKDWMLFGIRVDAALRAPAGNGLPGAVADRTLAVVADNVTVANIDGSTTVAGGNSFAAPAIAGAAALLKQHWPQLGGRDISRILLDSAKDLGAIGVDQVYGAGLLDIEAAMGPKSAVVPTASYSAASAAVRSLSFSGAFGSEQGAARWAAFAGQATAIDRYGRDYTADLRLDGTSRAAQSFSVYGVVAPTAPARWTPAPLNQAAVLVAHDPSTGAHALPSATPKAFAFRLSDGASVSGQSGGSIEPTNLMSGSKLRSLGLATQGTSTMVAAGRWALSVASAVSNTRSSTSRVQLVAIATPSGVTMGVATARETGSALGLTGSGDYRIQGADSTFLTLGWSGRIAGLRVGGEVSAGRTVVDARIPTLAFEPMLTTGFGARAQRSLFGGSGTLGVTSPLKVERARVRFTGPTGFDRDGLIAADGTRFIDLAPNRREVNLETGWTTMAGPARLSIGAAYGVNTGNQRGVANVAAWFTSATAW